MKIIKVFAAIAAALMLCSCGGSEAVDLQSGRKDEAFSPTGERAESTIFGRSVRYDAYTPAEGLSLPIPSDEILGMLQIQTRLYFLTNGAVYTLDIESGMSEKLFDTDATMFAIHDEMLYTYSAETYTLSEYDPSGYLSNELTLKVDGVESVLGLCVTDDYYVFICYIKGKMYGENHVFIYSRETCELTLSKKMSLMPIELFSYKGNKLLSVTIDESADVFFLGSFDAETGKNERLQVLDRIGNNPAVAYCPKTDTALVYSGPARIHELYRGSALQSTELPCCISEYSLNDTDRIVHNRYYLKVSDETRFFISVYENIVSAVLTADNEYRAFDYLNPPDSITVISSGGDNIRDAVRSFEMETGILVKNAYTDFDKLILKLMAGDNDFDIFATAGGYHHSADSGAYVDLKEIESLNSRISGNAAADLVVSYDGKYLGVPIGVRNYCTEEYYPENGSQFSYSLAVSESIYFARNIDIAEQRYSDPDGDELYKLFKFINDNPTGNRKKMPFGEEVTIFNAGVYMLNPQSQNYDNAIKFLEYLFDVYNGDIPGVVPEEDLYPKLESTENCYAEWRCRPVDIILPIFEARNAVLAQNGNMGNKELKKLAKETAAQVRMRIEE